MRYVFQAALLALIALTAVGAYQLFIGQRPPAGVEIILPTPTTPAPSRPGDARPQPHR